jgi:hypothetical protein
MEPKSAVASFVDSCGQVTKFCLRSRFRAPAVFARPRMQNKNRHQVAAYYFPNFHADPRNEARYGEGWTEWELLRASKPRYPGHPQPKIPAWGYEDEADPKVFAKKIEAAANHGLGAFIFDWYWYEGRPFLQRGLEEGYMGAPNNRRVPFCLMWANHDWLELFPRKYGQGTPQIFQGALDRKEFERVANYIVEKYFTHPAYWTVDGRPYFSIYEMGTFMRGFGTVKETRAALDYFHEITRKAGFPDLHLNMIVAQTPNLPSETEVPDVAERLNDLGVDSLTTYAWCHHSRGAIWPETPYTKWFEDNKAAWAHFSKFRQPYFPSVSMGWDSSPRTEQGKPWQDFGYPYSALLKDNTPAAFAEALAAAKVFLTEHPESKNIVTINAWNEWTEGSYLEPDTIDGFGYLESIRKVFPPAR